MKLFGVKLFVVAVVVVLSVFVLGRAGGQSALEFGGVVVGFFRGDGGASQLPGCVQTGYALRAFSRRAGWCL